MNAKPTLVVAVVAAALLGAGCQQRSPSDTTSSRSADQTTASVESKTGRATEKVAAAVDDTAITAKVKAAILAEPGLKSLQINVDTKDATVTLSGNVDSDVMRDRAKQIAMSTEGVKNVVDNLQVKTS